MQSLPRPRASHLLNVEGMKNACKHTCIHKHTARIGVATHSDGGDIGCGAHGTAVRGGRGDDKRLRHRASCPTALGTRGSSYVAANAVDGLGWGGEAVHVRENRASKRGWMWNTLVIYGIGDSGERARKI